ncbi:hypothetical protein VMCG_09750 [Cytospora schulzeri]|uniref:Nephrocystin 3-like N-terminal domain-containing protein n=1 Tax=Cytospora schulzeri TaxID=448051 RepID=A0A423VH45_9PEZI|nr:hypothetical protein VMCG_09750 [Valsa malicola]
MSHRKWRDRISIKRWEKSTVSSPARPSSAGSSLSMESSTAQASVMERPQGSSSLGTDLSGTHLPQVSLKPRLDASDTQGNVVVQSRTRLQQAYEELESVLQARNGPSASRSGLKDILTQENLDISQDTLLQILEEVKLDQETKTRRASSKAGAFMQKMFPLSKITLGLTGTLANNFGCAPVQIAANGLIQVMELAISIPEDSAKVVGALDAIVTDTRLLVELKRLPETAVEEMLANPATELHYQLIVFLRKGIVWLDKGFFRKFAGSLVTPSEMKDAISELHNAREALKTALLNDTYLTVRWQQVATMEAGMLDSLCPDEYHIAQLKRQKELHSSRLPASGHWLTDDERYTMWCEGKLRILWCPGHPGAGKTYMASCIVDDLESLLRSGNMGLAYVFCEANRHGQQSEQRVLEAFTRQLMARKPELCQDLKDSLTNSLPTIGDRKTLLKKVLGRFQGSFLVLDALDEFSPDYSDRRDLASSLKNIVEECGDNTTRLCITSRESSGIEEALSSGWALAETLNVRSSKGDIRKLVETAYDRAAPAIHWLKNDHELKQLAIEKVIDKSDCIFKLADLQIKSALNSPSKKAMKRALDTLTTDVNHYYEESLQRIVNQGRTGQTVLDLLTWLTYTKTPIYMHQLEFALGIEPNQPIGEDFADQVVDLPRFIGLSEGLATLGNTGGSFLDDPTQSDSDDSNTDDYHTDDSHTDDSHTDDSHTDDYHTDDSLYGPRVDLAHQSIRDYLSSSDRWMPQNGERFVLTRCLTAMTSPIFRSHLANAWEYVWDREQFYPSAKYPLISVNDSFVKVPGFLLWAVFSWGRYLTPTNIDAEIQFMVEGFHRSTSSHVYEQYNSHSESSKPARASALYWSARQGWTLACKLLLPLEPEPNNMFDRCMFPNTRDLRYAESAFLAALSTGDPHLVTTFLDDPRIDPNSLVGNLGDRMQFTPLIYACQTGHTEIIKVLLKRENIDINITISGKSAIFHATANVIDLLLARDDLEVNSDFEGGRVIHHLANVGGPSNWLKMLLRNQRTDVNARTVETRAGFGGLSTAAFQGSRTALMVASLAGRPDQVKVLSEHPGVEVGLRDDDGCTPLMLASMGRLQAHEVSDSVTVQRSEWWNYQYSIQQHTEVISILLRIGGDQINEQDNFGRTALAYAAMCGCEPRADTDITRRTIDDCHEYWYHCSSRQRKIDKKHFVTIVERLLEADGIQVNITDDQGYAPLDYVDSVKRFIVQERDDEVEYWTGIPKEDKSRKYVPDNVIETVVEEAAAVLSTLKEVENRLLAAGAQSKVPVLLPKPSEDRSKFYYALRSHLPY